MQKNTVLTIIQNIYVAKILRFGTRMFLQSACYRYHHDRCKGNKGCECGCHKKEDFENG